jgi:hypothetical protein
MRYNNSQRGISLIEALIMAGLLVLFFGGLIGAFRGIFIIITDSKAKQTALTIAMETIESVRSLDYAIVGTISGIPAGPIPQVSTTTQNGVTFTTRTLIEFIDDPADGLGALDGNGVVTDYKKATVAVEWSGRTGERTIQFSTSVTPPTIESFVGGGTLRVNVFDATMTPVSGASVRLVNTSISPSIDTIRTTALNGEVLFSGAPTASGYEVFVTKAGYTSDQTYVVTPTLTNPISSPVTIVDANVTTATFFIDEVSTVDVRAVTNQVLGSSLPSVVDFTDARMYDSVDATIAQGVTLLSTSGTYASAGYIEFNPITPTALAAWQHVTLTGAVPVGTTRRIQVYDGTAPGTLLSESVLPGNAVGFTGESVQLTGIDPGVYPSLLIRVTLSTTDTSITPNLASINVGYVTSETVVSSVPVNFVGSKSLGTDGSGTVIPRNAFTLITDSSGNASRSNIEWDFYSVDVPGYTITEACTEAPLTVRPDTSASVRLVLTSPLTHSLRVQVLDTLSVPITNATVTVSRPGFSDSQGTASCGQGFFSTVTGDTYTVEVSAPGYDTETFSGYVITTNQLLVVQLLPSI